MNKGQNDGDGVWGCVCPFVLIGKDVPPQISDAIPALTLPIGANPVSLLDTEFGEQRNFNMSANTFENGWPQGRLETHEGNNWWHSDFHQVAYPFTHNLYDDMVTFGDLK